MRDRRDRHAGGAVAQEHDHAAAFLFEPLQRRADGLRPAEHVADHVGAVQSRQHAFAVADAAVDERHVMHLVERRHIGVAGERADFRRHRKLADAFDELLAPLAVGDQVRDRQALEAVLFREDGNVGPAHHRAVVVDELADDADRLDFREPA